MGAVGLDSPPFFGLFRWPACPLVFPLALGFSDMSDNQPSLPGFGSEPVVPNKTVEDGSTPLDPRAVLPPQNASEPPRSLEGKTVYLVDTHSLIHQVFHALPNMSSPDGRPVNAIYGVVRDLLMLRKMKRPDYWFCAVDLPGGTFRGEIYPEYKANRKPADDELVAQIPEVHRMIAAMGIPVVGAPNFEADDCLATMARQIERLGGECYLVTSDKDCRQLISDRVRIYNIRKNEVFGLSELEEVWGVRPDQVVDFQALVGDSVDNVPGVPLIGPKLARELLGKYETLEGVLDHAEEVSGKKRKQNLIEGRDMALLSRQLVRLDDQVELALDWDLATVGPIDPGPVGALFVEFGFRSLLKQLDELAGEVDRSVAPKDNSGGFFG